VDIELVLSAGTLPEASFADRVRAAAANGYAGIGLRLRDYRRAQAEGLRTADARAMLADAGVAVTELEVVWDWAEPGDRGLRSRQKELDVYRMADAVGGRHVIVNSSLGVSRDGAAELLAGLADRAAEHGLVVAVEFLPWTDIGDVTLAHDLVRRAGRRNAGVLVDSWHYFHGAADPDALRAVPASDIVAVQIDDSGPREGDWLEDTMRRRLLPGEGMFDLVGFLRLLDAMGVNAPLGVEILSASLAVLPPVEAAYRAAEATRAVLRRAGLA
jgi:sugar phosphate isomerase/epimerase